MSLDITQKFILLSLCVFAVIIGFIEGSFSSYGNWVIIVTSSLYYLNFLIIGSAFAKHPVVLCAQLKDILMMTVVINFFNIPAVILAVILGIIKLTTPDLISGVLSFEINAIITSFVHSTLRNNLKSPGPLHRYLANSFGELLLYLYAILYHFGLTGKYLCGFVKEEHMAEKISEPFIAAEGKAHLDSQSCLNLERCLSNASHSPELIDQLRNSEESMRFYVSLSYFVSIWNLFFCLFQVLASFVAGQQWTPYLYTMQVNTLIMMNSFHTIVHSVTPYLKASDWYVEFVEARLDDNSFVVIQYFATFGILFHTIGRIHKNLWED